MANLTRLQLINELAKIVIESNRENYEIYFAEQDAGEDITPFSEFGTDEDTVSTVLSGVFGEVTTRVQESQA